MLTVGTHSLLSGEWTADAGVALYYHMRDEILRLDLDVRASTTLPAAHSEVLPQSALDVHMALSLSMHRLPIPILLQRCPATWSSTIERWEAGPPL